MTELSAHTFVKRQKTFPLRDNYIQRIALVVEYNGRAFHGWQRQASPAVATVQAVLEQSLSAVADHRVALVCAGRTDAGVHALAQVVHFDVAVERELKSWVLGVNSGLPRSVRVISASAVTEAFHARHSASARRYQYWIQNTAASPGIFDGQLAHCRDPLNADLMHSEAQCMLGERDFSSFRAAACQSHSPMRNVHHVRVFRRDDRVCIDIQANAFLLHMVRNIAGALMAVGSGRHPTGWLAHVLEQRDRRCAEITAKPDGLYLYRVEYSGGVTLDHGERGLPF